MAMSTQAREPKRVLKFEITKEDVEGASCADSMSCVLARAFSRQFQKTLLEIIVFPTITTLRWSGARDERYRTSPLLKKALDTYDKTNRWDLPPGTYALLPVKRNQSMEYNRERAARRRQRGDANMSKKYPNRKIHRNPIRARHINLTLFRQRNPIGEKAKISETDLAKIKGSKGVA